jgi:hypothetical protein
MSERRAEGLIPLPGQKSRRRVSGNFCLCQGFFASACSGIPRRRLDRDLLRLSPGFDPLLSPRLQRRETMTYIGGHGVASLLACVAFGLVYVHLLGAWQAFCAVLMCPGFCRFGCSTNAKRSALTVWIPRARLAGGGGARSGDGRPHRARTQRLLLDGPGPAADRMGGGEMLPDEANRVTLSDDLDQYGPRVARVSYKWRGNNKALIQDAPEQTRRAVRRPLFATREVGG